MAKKKKEVPKTRPNNWSKVKSVIWREQKERGVYKYNSKNFNALVSDVYQTLGKKYPKDIKKIVYIAEQSEYDLFVAPSPEPENIEYYNIDRALSAYQDNSFYGPFNIVTNFGGAFPDVEMPLADYEYQGSIFQGIIEKADEMRRDMGMKNTPEKKLVVEVDHKNQQIKIYVADQAPPKGTKAQEKAKEKKKRGYKNIAKTPEQIAEQAKKGQSIKSKLEKIETKIGKIEDSITIIINTGDKGFIEISKPLFTSLKDLQNEKNKLSQENSEVERYLADAKGFVKAKKSSKKSTKKQPKGTGPKRGGKRKGSN